jgi:hypothetical protein
MFVTAKHSKTFEITKHPQLTRRGDCVIAVRSTKGLRDLSAVFRSICRSDDARITVQLTVQGISESIEGTGSHHLTLRDPSEIVGRKSTYASDRTLMIHADRAARDINRDLIWELKKPDTALHVKLIAEF